jgi:hypothetical protein
MESVSTRVSRRTRSSQEARKPGLFPRYDQDDPVLQSGEKGVPLPGDCGYFSPNPERTSCRRLCEVERMCSVSASAIAQWKSRRIRRHARVPP